MMRTRGAAPWSTATALTIGLAVVFGAVAAQQRETVLSDATETTFERVPLIDLHAYGVFDLTRPAARSARVDYQVNATVLVPLLFTSIPFVSRDDVGVASFTARDFDEAGETLRAFEFFAASDPARARGLNRLGFFREAVALGDDGARWTAQFGVMTIDRADSRASAAAQFDDEQDAVVEPQPMSMNDAWIEPNHATSAVSRLMLGGLWTHSTDFYRDILPLWRATPVEDDDRRTLSLGGTRYDEPVGFFGGIQRSARLIAGDLEDGRKVRKKRYPYVHNSELFHLDLRGHKVDERRVRTCRERGLVPEDATVHKLDFRVVDGDGDEADSFTLWTELPVGAAIGPLGPAIMPVEFEYKPRAFLRLNGVRVVPSGAMDTN